MNYSFVICDDHPLINDSIELFLNKIGHTCRGKLTSNSELLNFFESSTADVLICDLNIDHENTFEVLEKIKNGNPELFIVLFSAYSDRFFIQKAKEIGVSIYASKTTELVELYKLIDLNTREFFTNCQFESDKKMFIQTDFSFEEEQFKLSDQEKKIVTLILAGETSDQIATKLFISKYTVDTHRKNINKKLNVSGIIQLQEKVLKFKLL